MPLEIESDSLGEGGGVGRGGGEGDGFGDSEHTHAHMHTDRQPQPASLSHPGGNVGGEMESCGPEQSPAAQQTLLPSRERAVTCESGGGAGAGHASGVAEGSRCGGQLAGGDAADSKDTGSGDRYVVAGVASSGGERGNARVVVLTLTHAASGATREVRLQGAWADTQVAAGDHVVVMGTGDFSGHASQVYPTP